jgi:putative ABC transport system ATP-binding protein
MYCAVHSIKRGEKMTEIVKLEGVTKVYQDGKVAVPALRGIDLSLQKGEFVAVAGPSGSGKTTLLNIIGGLDKPSQGSVMLEDKLLSTMTRGELSRLRLNRIGFIFQSYNLIPVLTALENAEFVLLLQKCPAEERRQRVVNLLEEVGLSGLENRFPRDMLIHKPLQNC